MSTILEINEISKKFVISHLGEPYLNFRDKLKFSFQRSKKEEFWALQKVSFEVTAGEALGIVGRNGAGKSTLLKILSRITPPTSGHIVSRGSIASLLEVGTGFHQELTGRENILMNGSILGMKRKRILEKFDEIVDFSGTEKFLDTQLKHYSSGMQLRLAFAVSSTLEPDILIIDEVLAVGDAEFQRKCIDKMKAVVKQGRTLILVSHNLETVAKMCRNGILLDYGKVEANGAIEIVLKKYQENMVVMKMTPLIQRNDRIGNGVIRFKSIVMTNSNGQEISTVFSGQSINFVFEFENNISGNNSDFQLDIGLTSKNEEKVAWFSTTLSKENVLITKHHKSITLSIEDFPFMPGEYNLTVFCKFQGEVSDWVSNAFPFTVEAGDFFGSGNLVLRGWGPFLVHHQFKL